MALVFAGIVALLTLCWCAFVSFANGMSPTGDGPFTAWPMFIIGTVLACVIASLHWLPL